MYIMYINNKQEDNTMKQYNIYRVSHIWSTEKKLEKTVSNPCKAVIERQKLLKKEAKKHEMDGQVGDDFIIEEAA